MKTRWSLGDLQNYCKESTRSFNMAMQWPTILEILTSNDQKGLCLPHEPTSREATRRIQIMRGHLKAVQRRRLTGGLGGETLTPAETGIEQLRNILQTYAPMTSAAHKAGWKGEPMQDEAAGINAGNRTDNETATRAAEIEATTKQYDTYPNPKFRSWKKSAKWNVEAKTKADTQAAKPPFPNGAASEHDQAVQGAKEITPELISHVLQGAKEITPELISHVFTLMAEIIVRMHDVQPSNQRCNNSQAPVPEWSGIRA